MDQNIAIVDMLDGQPAPHQLGCYDPGRTVEILASRGFPVQRDGERAPDAPHLCRSAERGRTYPGAELLAAWEAEEVMPADYGLGCVDRDPRPVRREVWTWTNEAAEEARRRDQEEARRQAEEDGRRRREQIASDQEALRPMMRLLGEAGIAVEMGETCLHAGDLTPGHKYHAIFPPQEGKHQMCHAHGGYVDGLAPEQVATIIQRELGLEDARALAAVTL